MESEASDMVGSAYTERGIAEEGRTQLPNASVARELEKEMEMLEQENRELRRRLMNLGDPAGQEPQEQEPASQQPVLQDRERSATQYSLYTDTEQTIQSRRKLAPAERVVMDAVRIKVETDGDLDRLAGSSHGSRHETAVSDKRDRVMPGTEQTTAKERASVLKRSVSSAVFGDSKGQPLKGTKPKPAKIKSKAPDQTHILYSGNPEDLTKPSAKERVVQHSRFQQFVLGDKFELLSASIILTNTIVMAFSMQYNGLDSGYVVGYPSYSNPASQIWPSAPQAFRVCNYIFNACFTIELVLRFMAVRWRGLCMGWMWFDTIIVALGIADLASDGKGIGINPGMMRVIRLVRLVRLLKIFQAMSSFDSLFLLLKAIQASWHALVWSFLLLFMVQLITGLILCQLLNDFINDGSQEVSTRQEVFKYFGTFARTLLTMFEITLANWIPSCRTLSEDVTPWFILFYIVYRCMFAFAILKVIAAVFITETNRVLASDDELTRMKRRREGLLYHNKLSKMFKSIDTNRDGHIDWNELQAILNDEEKASWLPTLGFEPNDFEKLFWLIDEGDGEVEIAEFLKKVGRLKGLSKTIDMLTLCKLAHRIDRRVSCMSQLLDPAPSDSGNENQDENVLWPGETKEDGDENVQGPGEVKQDDGNDEGASNREIRVCDI